MRNLRRLLALLLCLPVCAGTCCAAPVELVDPLSAPPERGFISRVQAEFWEEALISGNGTIGALVMGRPENETITFSHERLFMPWHPSQPIVDMAPRLPEIRRLINDRQYRKAAEFVSEVAKLQGYDDMRWTDPLTPAFDLALDMRRNGEVRKYLRSVNFASGVAAVRWEDDRGVFIRRLFVSRADNLAAILIQADQPGAVACRVALQPTASDGPTEDEEDESYVTGITNVSTAAKDSALTYSCRFARKRADSSVGYEGVALVSAIGGTIRDGDREVVVDGADEVVILISLDVLTTDSSRLAEQTKRLRNLKVNFDELLDRHRAIHGALFKRVRFDLGGGTDRSLPSERLLEKSSFGNLNPALLEKLFDASRYAILSSSGELPPTLQGIWSGNWSPPWQSDFTQNGNVPSAISAMLMSNLPECMESYLTYMESLVPHFRENARKLYGCRGIMVPSRTSSHGYNIHFDDEYCHLFWTPGAAWASHFFYDYYLHTGDRNFLRDRALPFMKEAALFFEDFLFEGPDGYFVFNPSYSPENTPANSDSQACINATMDIALVKELLRNLIAACDELDCDHESAAKWKLMLEKMPPYRINEDGTLAEWTTDKLRDNHQHRHISHLCALFDGLPAEVADSPELRDAFKAVIENRMQPRRQNGGGIMSFGLVQLGQTAATLGEAELAYETVDMLANVYWRPNLVSTHNPDEIFNVDVCGGLPAIIIKMLVSSMPGRIELLPALPHQWPAGSIEGLLCRGQVSIEQLAWSGEEVRVRLRSPIDQTVEVRLRGGFNSFAIEGDSATINRVPGRVDAVQVGLPGAKSLELRFAR